MVSLNIAGACWIILTAPTSGYAPTMVRVDQIASIYHSSKLIGRPIGLVSLRNGDTVQTQDSPKEIVDKMRACPK